MTTKQTREELGEIKEKLLKGKGKKQIKISILQRYEIKSKRDKAKKKFQKTVTG